MLLYGIIIFIVAGCYSKSLRQEDIVAELTNRFYDVSTECLDDQNQAQPLYKCSGMLIRGITYSIAKKFAWYSPRDFKDQSLSFSFLRRDQTYDSQYESGFIFYPQLKTPSQKKVQNVLCAFPLNAATNVRIDRGCGKFSGDHTGLTQPCELQNITSFEDWLIHHKKVQQSSSELGCGFDMTKETAARSFALSMKANTYLQAKLENVAGHNELLLEAWDENNAKQIPIEAFFYVIDSKNAREHAVKNQKDFYIASGGEEVPVVGIRFPTKSNPEIYIEAV